MTSVFSLPFLALFVYLFFHRLGLQRQAAAPHMSLHLHCYLVLILVLLSVGPCLSQGAASAINDLENQLFFRQYDGEKDVARLSRMENYIFGQSYNDSVENRIARIKAAVPAIKDVGVPAPQNPAPSNNWSPQAQSSQNSATAAEGVAPVARPGNDDNGDAQSRQLQVMEARANQVNTLLSQAVSLYRQKQFKEAIDLFEQVIRLDPQNASAHFSLGIALEANGNLPQAASEYNQSSSIEPDNKDYQLAVQSIKNKLDEQNKTKMEDYKWQLLASQAADALKNGQVDQALAMYNQLIEKDPHQALYQYNVGTIYLMQKKPQDALPHYKSAHKLEPANKIYEQSLQKLELSLKEVKEKEKAVKESEKAAKEDSHKKIDLRATFGLELKPSRDGVMVKKTIPGLRASSVGLFPQDVIKAVDGVGITKVSQLEQILASKPMGQRFQMILIRRKVTCQLLF